MVDKNSHLIQFYISFQAALFSNLILSTTKRKKVPHRRCGSSLLQYTKEHAVGISDTIQMCCYLNPEEG